MIPDRYYQLRYHFEVYPVRGPWDLETYEDTCGFRGIFRGSSIPKETTVLTSTRWKVAYVPKPLGQSMRAYINS